MKCCWHSRGIRKTLEILLFRTKKQPDQPLPLSCPTPGCDSTERQAEQWPDVTSLRGKVRTMHKENGAHGLIIFRVFERNTYKLKYLRKFEALLEITSSSKSVDSIQLFGEKTDFDNLVRLYLYRS